MSDVVSHYAKLIETLRSLAATYRVLGREQPGRAGEFIEQAAKTERMMDRLESIYTSPGLNKSLRPIRRAGQAHRPQGMRQCA